VANTLTGSDLIREHYPLDEVLGNFHEGSGRAVLRGAQGSFLASILVDLQRRLERPVVVFSEEDEAARALCADLAVFCVDGGDAHHFPSFDIGPFQNASGDRRVEMQRQVCLHRLTQNAPEFVVTSVDAAMRRTTPRLAFESRTQELRVDMECPDLMLRTALHQCGYRNVDLVEDPGTYCVRGDIVDIFSPGQTLPVRLERWGDVVTAMRSFDPRTQRSQAALEGVWIHPIQTAVLDPERIPEVRRKIRQRSDAISLPSRVTQRLIEDLEAGVRLVGIDQLSPSFHETRADLFDYLAHDALLVVLEPTKVVARGQGLWDERCSEHVSAIGREELVFEIEDYYRSMKSLENWLEERPMRIDVERVGLDAGQGAERTTFLFQTQSNLDLTRMLKEHAQEFETLVARLADLLWDWKKVYGRICFACRTWAQVERLRSLLVFHGHDAIAFEPPVDLSEPVPPPAMLIEIYRADVSSGFRSEILGLCLVSGTEIFGQRVATTSAESIIELAAVAHFKDLKPGDHLVHLDYGVGRYEGLVQHEIEGVTNDFLDIQYAGSGRLLLPVHRLGRVQKYIGASEGVRLDKLGGTSWEKTKERVKRHIQDIASDLLDLYARREMAKGISYNPPDAFYRQFETAFPFEETPDQRRAISETLADMVRERPMDRLICGDVGFGKTEIAIRAAMKAVVDQRQVAVLTPTTLLCEQHVISFRARCEPFGVRVEGLSRFRSPSEARAIIEDAKSGKIDILVGTHRLLSKDIGFRRLGLMIVDEEQRFGVTHKEKIKRLRADIDVLTLTATPIPRTLQMSLLGIRDLSIIATPPHHRLSVRTILARKNDEIIEQAVRRELARGGQVFFVHNRVSTIEETAIHLRGLIPGARISVGHGQMTESKLEEVMVSYVQGDTDVLVCSAIIESGLDIPNANTIIINRADKFGLAQLYQLRGRVGRGRERAYAYLLVPSTERLKKEAEKRLEVIQNHTDLGSGFHVATYDLEIRGAGNLLGGDQSGHVAMVGLDMYTELLVETMTELKGEDQLADIEPEVSISISASIPESYVGSTSLRLMFYKRFSLAKTHDEAVETFEEMKDRFGPAPKSVDNLVEMIHVKVSMRRLRAIKLDVGPSAISIELDRSTTLRPEPILSLVKAHKGRLVVGKDRKLTYYLKPDESARPMASARYLIEQLVHVL
jgi:transcription-repair coupling factor (superfamily II helicase)